LYGDVLKPHAARFVVQVSVAYSAGELLNVTVEGLTDSVTYGALFSNVTVTLFCTVFGPAEQVRVYVYVPGVVTVK
jgi:hypothetical protein